MRPGGHTGILSSTVTVIRPAAPGPGPGPGDSVPDAHQTGLRWAGYEFSATRRPVSRGRGTSPAFVSGPGVPAHPRPRHSPGQRPDRPALPGPGLVSELAREPYRLPESLRAAAPSVLQACNHGRLVFNGEVVGMRGDPLPPICGRVTPIRLHTARFFDSQCSNDLCALRITHRDSGEDCDPRPSLLATPGGRCAPSPRVRWPTPSASPPWP